MVICQGDIFWADLGEPRGSETGYLRPVVVVQGDSFNRSQIATIVCIILTSNVRRVREPGNLLLPKESSGLPADSVVNVSQILSVDRRDLLDRVGRVSDRQLKAILAGLDIVLGR